MDQTVDTGTQAIAATMITVWGVATGLSYEVLLAGFAGGLVSLSFLPPLGIFQRIWTLVTATLTAGYTAPVLAHYLTGVIGSDSPLGMLAFSGFVMGVSAQIVLPAAMTFIRNKLVGMGGQTS